MTRIMIRALRRRLGPLAASFRLGVGLAFAARPEIVSMLTIYGVLLVLFHTIVGLMPLEELGITGLTHRHILWYFATTECLIVGAQGLERQFGMAIAEGQLTAMMQRPGDMMALYLARILGTFAGRLSLLAAMALVVMPFLVGAPPLSLAALPLLIASLMLGALLVFALGYILSMAEIFGGYSKPLNWIFMKFIFTFGGLSFPVVFFPAFLKKIALWTPFPAILYGPASVMLGPAREDAAGVLLPQLGWLCGIILIARLAEAKLVRRVLVKGE